MGLTNTDIILRLLLSTFLSSIVGFERSTRGRAAGLRTHILVGLGSTLFMLISIFIAKDGGNYDPARLAAGVVTGIGFLGAGTIIRFGASVKGLTTAASLWAVSALGLAVGTGFYLPAIVTTAIVLVTLMVLPHIEEKFYATRTRKNKS